MCFYQNLSHGSIVYKFLNYSFLLYFVWYVTVDIISLANILMSIAASLLLSFLSKNFIFFLYFLPNKHLNPFVTVRKKISIVIEIAELCELRK